MSLDPNDGRTPKIQVAEAIRRAIAAGTYPRGAQIPSVPELAEQYGVAKQTANNAVKLLQDAGLLVSRVGSGTFVRTDVDDDQIGRPIDGSEPSAEFVALSARVDELSAAVRDLATQVTALQAQVSTSSAESE
jgi:DNA-binding GntR family transcriptional regulator